MNVKKKIFVLLVFILLLVGISNRADASADVNLTIRDGNTIIFSGIVPLPASGTVSLDDIGGNPRNVDTRSVLSLVHEADLISSDFSISNLTYFSSFGSLYLNCITSSQGEHCDDWQYVVNDAYPFVGMDQNILSGGEEVYVYFGPQSRISLNSSSITVSGSATVTSEIYDYKNNDWRARSGVTVGLTQPNPADPWSPIEIITKTTNVGGQAIFSSIPIGTYNVGIKEDFYFPTEALTVKDNPKLQSTTTYENLTITKEEVQEELVFDTTKALNFLSSQQKKDGSFGENMYTDWVAIAFASNSQYRIEKDKIIKYFEDNKLSGAMLTDFERRTMALMALGINPYDAYGENYIEKITNHFDGTQFGDSRIDNDDIFALIVLSNAGFGYDEDIMTKTLKFVLSKQRPDGSWDESTDMTGAGIGALSNFPLDEQIKISTEKAVNFLKENQKTEGGWGNISSTAWAINGILSVSQNPIDWEKNGNTPLSYLAKNQDIDGGMKNKNLNNKIWETAYATTAVSNKSWNEILKDFTKEEQKVLGAEIEVKTIEKEEADKNIAPKIVTKPKEENLPKLEDIAKNTTITEVKSQPAEEDALKKKSWFGKLFQKIFNIFF